MTGGQRVMESYLSKEGTFEVKPNWKRGMRVWGGGNNKGWGC